MQTKHWAAAEQDWERARMLMREGGYSLLTAAVLVARGMDTPARAAAYLDTDFSGLHEPLLMKGMAQAVALIEEAIRMRTPVLVCGDHDVDGVTAACMVTDYLRKRGVPCDCHLISRQSDGYSVTYAELEGFYRRGTRLLITVDCGIAAAEEVETAQRIGMKVIVTDHHECHDALPPADAVVDCKRRDGTYPFPSLAGVGVAFKLLCALERSASPVLDRYADLVALGTVADVMPLIGENRILVAAGLEKMAAAPNLGLDMLLREAGIRKQRLTSSVISYVLAPRLNAAGRMGKAELAAELLLTNEPQQAKELAVKLCEQNRRRQNEESRIFKQAVNRLRAEYDPLEDKIIILAGEGWRHGMIGAVCSRLCSRFGCPVLLIALDRNGCGKGSGRSIPGFSLFDALHDCNDLLQQYGGHDLAVGLTMRRENLPALRTRLRAYAEARFAGANFRPQLAIDCVVEPSWITLENVDGLKALEPYGMDNPEPIFCMRDMRVEDITPISSDRHVQLTLSRDGVRFSAIQFGAGLGGLHFAQGNLIDAAFHLEICETRGKSGVQLVLCDTRLSESETQIDQRLLRMYHTYMEDGPLTVREARILLPDRADLVAVWRHIVCRAESGRLTALSSVLSRRIAWESQREIHIGKLFVCLDVFSESRLISYHFKEGMLNILLKPYQGKADISGSVVLATLQSMAG